MGTPFIRETYLEPLATRCQHSLASINKKRSLVLAPIHSSKCLFQTWTMTTCLGGCPVWRKIHIFSFGMLIKNGIVHSKWHSCCTCCGSTTCGDSASSWKRNTIASWHLNKHLSQPLGLAAWTDMSFPKHSAIGTLDNGRGCMNHATFGEVRVPGCLKEPRQRESSQGIRWVLYFVSQMPYASWDWKQFTYKIHTNLPYIWGKYSRD